ncbi:MAG: hypothetical protein WD825_08145 [Gemmatimonadaceae bacterium]
MLRFCSDDVTLDLADWPDDWVTLPDDALIELLRRASIPSYLPLQYRIDPARLRAHLSSTVI